MSDSDFEDSDLNDGSDQDEMNPDNYLHEINYDPLAVSQQQAACLKVCESDCSSASTESLHSEIIVSSAANTEGNDVAVLSDIDNPSNLLFQSPEKEQPPVSEELSLAPLSNATGEEEDDNEPLVEKFRELMKRIPYLTIPRHFGFSRRVSDTPVTMDGDGPCQKVTYEHEDATAPFNSIEEIHNYLLERKIPLPVSTFTFESNINPHVKYFKECWQDMIFKDDLSDGMERKKIQVICAKTRSPDKVASYVMDNFLDENVDISMEHDDEFFVCCECPNDCRDKLNCPCFQKTLDNCSEAIKNEVRHEDIGFVFQRLYAPVLSGIFECNKRCKCRKNTCFNRVVQNGINCDLQLFKTDCKGWGVRVLHQVPKGSFICMYAGKIVSGQYADKVSANWHSGKWKYLSELRVSTECKEGFEAEVVDESATGAKETFNNLQNSDYGEMEQFWKENDDGGMYDSQVSQPAEIASEEWMDFMQDDEMPEEQCSTQENDENIIDTKPSTSTFMRRRGGGVGADQICHRILRSSETLYQENPQDYEFLPTGRNRLMKTTLKDVIKLSRLNRKVQKQSQYGQYTAKRFANKRKPTYFMFLDDFHAMREEDEYYDKLNELKANRKKDRKRIDALQNSSRISVQATLDFLKAFKGEGDSSLLYDTGTKQIALAECSTLNKTTSSALRRVKLSGNKTKRLRGRKKLLINYEKNVKEVDKKICKHPLLDLHLNIDGIDFGNIGRYCNHSCDPNMFPQYVFTTSHDLRLPRIGLFAKRDISAGEELTWDYKYEPANNDEEKKYKYDGDQQQQQEENQVQEQPQAYISDDKGNISLAPAATFKAKRMNIRRGTRRGIRNGCGKGRGSFKRAASPTPLQCHCGEDNCKRRFS